VLKASDQTLAAYRTVFNLVLPALHHSNGGHMEGVFEHMGTVKGQAALIKAVTGRASAGRKIPSATCVRDRYSKVIVLLEWAKSLLGTKEEQDAVDKFAAYVAKRRFQMRVPVAKEVRRKRLVADAARVHDIFEGGAALHRTVPTVKLVARLRKRLDASISVVRLLSSGVTRAICAPPMAFALSLMNPTQRKVRGHMP
jgi:hypothetical protein